MRLETFLLADHAAAAPDGKLYINGGGITRLAAPTIPFAVPLLSVILRFQTTESDTGEHWILLRLQDPNGVDLLPADPSQMPEVTTSGLKDEEHYVQIVMSFGGLPILNAGTYKFSVELDGKTVREVTLPVVLAGDSSGPAERSLS